MRRWKKVILTIIFGIIIFVILLQNIGVAILCGEILFSAYHLIDTRDTHRKIISNRNNREKYYDNTKRS